MPLAFSLSGMDSVRTTVLGRPRRGNLVALIPGPEIILSNSASRSCAVLQTEAVGGEGRAGVKGEGEGRTVRP